MQQMSVSELVKAVGGQILVGNDLVMFNSVVIDSRKISENCLFVALEGKRVDGHDFVVDSLNNGARVAIVQKENIIDLDKVDTTTHAVIKVTNTLIAMQALAAHYRNKFSIPVIAITGSVGKTTTKEMCYHVLSGKYNTLKNYGNLNSDIGMPLTMFNLESDHEVAIFEMGMSNKGEIEVMSKIAMPYLAIITNIGISHIEQLKTKENILKAKLEIEKGLNTDGTMILNGDDKMLNSLKGKLVHPVIYYGVENTNCDFYADEIHTIDGKTNFRMNTPFGSFNLTLNCIGKHNVSNAVAAVAAGICTGLSENECREGLGSYGENNLRQKIINLDDMILIDDTYNAAPDSMLAALDILKTTNASRKIAVLSDMLELGEKTVSSHIKIGKVAGAVCDYLFCYGELSKNYLDENNDKIIHFDTSEQCAVALTKLAKPYDAILFKGSRGQKVEQCMEMFIKERK